MTRTEMSKTEELLTRMLHTYADDTEVSPDGLDRIGQKRSSRGWVRRSWPGLVVAGVTLAVGLGAIVLANDPADQITRAPDVLGQPGDVGPIDTWQRVPLGAEHDCGDRVAVDCMRLVEAVPFGRGGFLVAGNQGGTPIVYVSPDGRTWGEAVRLPVAGRDARGNGVADAVVEALVTDGERYVAVGTRYPKGLQGGAVVSSGAAWVSDDGSRWEAVDLGPAFPAAVTDVARTGQGFTATGLLVGGRSDVVSLGLWSSPDGRSWTFDGHLGGPLAVGADGVLPLVGIEAGAGALVYAEIRDPGAHLPCAHAGVAVWTGSKDGLPTIANGDDPQRPGMQGASPGLETAVLRPCGNVEASTHQDGQAGTVSSIRTSIAPLRPGVTWDGARPTLYLHRTAAAAAPGESGAMNRQPVDQHRYVLDRGVWSGQPLAVITEQTSELIGAAGATDGYRLAVVPQDGSLMSEDRTWSLSHHAGDGAGFGLGIGTDDGAGWTFEPYVADDAPAAERARMTGALQARSCEGGYGAVGVRTWTVSGNHLLLLGRSTPCLASPGNQDRGTAPFVPALWIGPLP